jgi:hypothetical protein
MIPFTHHAYAAPRRSLAKTISWRLIAAPRPRAPPSNGLQHLHFGTSITLAHRCRWGATPSRPASAHSPPSPQRSASRSHRSARPYTSGTRIDASRVRGPPARSTKPSPRRKLTASCAAWTFTTSPSTQAGSTWSRSRSACCAASASIAAWATATNSAPRSPHGSSSATLPALASIGCSPPNERAAKWPALTPPSPTSHNPCAAVLVSVEAAARRGISDAFLLFSDVFHAKLTKPQERPRRRGKARLDKIE